MECQEQEREPIIQFPKLGNRKGMKKKHSQNSGTGRKRKNLFPDEFLDEFLEKFQTTFDRPTPSFCENYISILFMMSMVAYIQGGMVAR